ncbi:MAG TPA: histidine kinase dimerization/phospho-acceptor domain-containing protein [Candidatus Limnocylindrales bacterium]|nr:histidine kinase dimerization/phospho-acceptor domain-containing protein [Candidatus Limnocylindrales bacterium]
MRGAVGGGIAAGVVAAIGIHQMRARAHEKRARSELDRLLALLPHCGDEDQAISAAERAFTSAFACPLAILSYTGEPALRRHTPGYPASPDDLAAGRQAMCGARVIRRRTGNGTYSHFVPLLTWRGAVGVLAFAPNSDLPRRMLRIVRAFADQVALTLLRSALANEARDATWLSEADRFQKALLNSIAHNVRTPLASIIGVLSTLQEDHAVLNPDLRRDLVETARQEADRLNRIRGRARAALPWVIR